jgi:hypothetical protein
VAVAVFAAALVFGLWFPGVYRHVAGGRSLFLLITTVDIILGPLLTFAVFNLAKTRRHLAADLGVVVALQLSALGYGLYTVYYARPVAMVFETDRLRVVTVAQVEMSELPLARPEYQSLPFAGPWLLGTRAPVSGDERNEALFRALEKGVDLGQRPKFWQPYADSREEALRRARPVSLLLGRYPQVKPALTEALTDAGLSVGNARFLPLVGREGDWIAILDINGQPVQYLPVEGFF